MDLMNISWLVISFFLAFDATVARDTSKLSSYVLRAHWVLSENSHNSLDVTFGFTPALMLVCLYIFWSMRSAFPSCGLLSNITSLHFRLEKMFASSEMLRWEFPVSVNSVHLLRSCTITLRLVMKKYLGVKMWPPIISCILWSERWLRFCSLSSFLVPFMNVLSVGRGPVVLSWLQLVFHSLYRAEAGKSLHLARSQMQFSGLSPSHSC